MDADPFSSPGAAIPPIETLKTFLPSDHLWPIDDVWIDHTGGNIFHNLDRFNKGLNLRYGESNNLEEYALKSQVFAYDNHRAMFEAYGRKKYEASTGVIQWMLNNPWSSLIWHLFDHELRAGGSYFGAKKGNEPLHIQYSYDDRSIVVVNHFTKDFQDLDAVIRVYDFDLNEKFALEKSLSIPEDSVKTVTTIPDLDGISETYFLKLELKNSEKKIISRNFYWLSTKKEVLDFTHTSTSWVSIPTTTEANLTLLNRLEPAQVNMTKEFSENKKGIPLVKVSLTNTSSHLAFAVHARVVQTSNGGEVLPSLWEDNYISLMPGESRSLSALLPSLLGHSSNDLSVQIDGWNVVPK